MSSSAVQWGSSEQSRSFSPVALITGSGKERIGFRLAEDLGRRGYRIVLHYRSSGEQAERNRERLESTGVECLVCQADLAEQGDVERMFREINDRFGRIDALVMCASIWNPCRLEEIDTDEVLAQFRANSLASFLCARAAGLRMAEQAEGGAIVLFGDMAIHRPTLDYAAYFLSKGAIPTLTKVLAVELSARNPRVRVNCIEPGSILFPPDASRKEKEQMIAASLVKQADCPDEVSLTVRFLLENTFLTGSCVPLDGGRHLYQSEQIERNRG